jgi:ABC-2 type transport system permease protein
VVVDAGAGESVAVEIVTDFQPERLVVDPDVRQLQLERNGAEEKL